MNRRGNLLGAPLMAILTSRLGMRLASDAMRSAMTSDAIGSIGLTLRPGLPVRSGVIGIGLLGVTFLASALVASLQRAQTMRPVTFDADRALAPMSAAGQHFAHGFMAAKTSLLCPRTADHKMRFSMTAQTGRRILSSLSQELAMRAGVVDILDVLMAGDATGRLQRAGMRIVLDSGQIGVAIHAGDPSLTVLAGVELPNVHE